MDNSFITTQIQDIPIIEQLSVKFMVIQWQSVTQRGTKPKFTISVERFGLMSAIILFIQREFLNLAKYL